MKDIFDIKNRAEIPINSSYIRSYPSLIRFFEGKCVITGDDIICGAHMIYGWMPTILEIDFDQKDLDLEGAAHLLMKAREEHNLTDEEITSLARLINHSFVGASKLLHFAAPEDFAIWDSKVYSFVHRKTPYHYRINDINHYREYLNKIKHLKEDPRFDALHQYVNVNTGYPVTPMRAIELIMFLEAPSLG
jgi:hypothetical protein